MPRAAWRSARLAGSALLLSGVVANVAGYVVARRAFAAYRPAVDAVIVLELGAVVAGAVLVVVGLWPSLRSPSAGTPATGMRVVAEGALTRRHWALAGLLALTVVIDVMKPDTIGFALPGARREYGLSAAAAALWPVVVLAGGMVGAVAWGILADRAGRRQALLLAALLFTATATSATMPTYGWNLVASFAMGLSVGGVLPIVYALVIETMPTRHRGWIAVLIGGLSALTGYFLTALSATLIEPPLGWRPLWIVSLPTGLILLVLARWLPESPRLLLARGRAPEARRVMARFGMSLVPRVPSAEPDPSERRAAPSHGLLAALCFYGVAWGMLNYGFLTWLPSILRIGGLPPRTANALLAVSSLSAAPAVPLAAYLYARQHTGRLLVGFASATAGALAAVAVAGLGRATAAVPLAAALVALLMSAGGASLVLWVYSSEAFPTVARTTRSGVVTASTRLGGLVGPLLMAATLTVWPGMTAPALVSGVPMVLGAALVLRAGRDTRRSTAHRRPEPDDGASETGAATREAAALAGQDHWD